MFHCQYLYASDIGVLFLLFSLSHQQNRYDFKTSESYSNLKTGIIYIQSLENFKAVIDI